MICCLIMDNNFPIITIYGLLFALNKNTSKLLSLNNHGMRIVTWNIAKNSNSHINALNNIISVLEVERSPGEGNPVKNV